MKAEVKRHRLTFKFEAGTSRGVMTSKDSWFLKMYDQTNPGVMGIGECGPLPGLSPDLEGDLEGEINKVISQVNNMENAEDLKLETLVAEDFPALRFAAETAMMDLKCGGERFLFKNAFTLSNREIPINGLVWMGDKRLMVQRIREKIESGFNCIKIKIGAIYYEEELELLQYIRSEYSAKDIAIRLDANGAFEAREVMNILYALARYEIHSIEQPIKAGSWEAMQSVCRNSPIPIALDEELIGVKNTDQKRTLLKEICPQFIILKPTLVGGLAACREWIKLAEERGIGWWLTSALESNIGLNAIAQFAAEYDVSLPQGLGTGQLFHNNIPSPLYVRKGQLGYNPESSWDISAIL